MEIGMNEDGIVTTPETGAQSISERIENVLDPKEPEAIEGEVAQDDGKNLPESDDTDPNEEEGSEDGLNEGGDFDDDQSIAALLGIDEGRVEVGEDGQVYMKAIIDGESKQVSLKDLAASYQLQGHVNNKSIAIENDRKEFEDIRSRAAGELQQRIAGAEALSQVLEDSLVGEYKGIDWDALRVENPSEWSALRQEFAEKANKVRDVQGLVAQEKQRFSDEQNQQSHAQMQSYVQEELSKMIADNPSWADETVRTSDQSSLRTFLESTYGFSNEDMASVVDHRLVNALRDAKLYHEGKSGAAAKKEKRVPKFRKPGAVKANANQLAKARDVKSKRAKVKASGHISDVANLLVDRM